MGASTFRKMRMRNKKRLKAGKPVLHMRPEPQQVLVEPEEIEIKYEGEEVELEGMTKKELLQYVEDNDLGIEYPERMKKADLVEAIEEEMEG